MRGEIEVRRALLSVYDKTGVVEFARRLCEQGVALVATGATATAIREAGLPVTALEERTGFGELFGGRVKTLTPQVHGGLLMQRDSARDRDEAAAHGIEPIDLLCVNLYPFLDTIAAAGDDRKRCIEMIDIGGPAMIRAAAKNHQHVLVVPTPAHYGPVAEALAEGGGRVSRSFSAELAGGAFALTAAYDAAIHGYLASPGALGDRWAAGGPRWQALRYGENPSQPAACYVTGGGFWRGLVQHQGKELSYNNLADLWAGCQAVGEFDECAAVVIKHRTPSGVALGRDPAEAFVRARDGDPLSAFGGVVALNRVGDRRVAECLAEMFLEVVLAPEWSAEALETLRRKKNLRVLAGGDAARGAGAASFYSLGNAVLVQGPLPALSAPAAWNCVTREGAADDTLAELEFAWRVVRHVRSNAIAVTKERRTLGLGGGQTSRIDACEVALMKARRAEHETEGSVLASDAFFPFADVVERAAAAGVRAIVQPGGSRRDEESIAACARLGIPMYFTGERVFAH
ncbi:MAG: bifunctional phosphoribosylaminoimidazolecarboxamide formyltransferase/IMP cyclohydrolase [Candidatus Eisenbacteria sp.]|nr:bifunctional phosphoribosylaminoimidazolecarboxamide formyltransferase/IMP cyclohydrolase [Candidatus Eisenbacteria bacterium]